MTALKYSMMILLSVFISCSSDDDDDDHHHDPNWSYQIRRDPIAEQNVIIGDGLNKNPAISKI